MNLLEAVILALVQGLTEFLPVSSSGHLALAEALLGDDGATATGDVFYEVLLHVATLLAVIVWFRRELLSLFAAFGRSPDARPARRVILLLGAASVPTAAIGLALREAAEAAFVSPFLVGCGLLVTAALLASTARLLGRRADGPSPSPTAGSPGAGHEWIGDLARLRIVDAVLVGCAQGCAVWPGVSRSGATIVVASWRGVEPVTAARFSLLASLPAILGAFALKLGDLEGIPAELPAWLVGFVVALVVGYLAIGWLLAVVRTSRLAWFAAYTGLLGGAAILLARMG